MSEVKLEPCPFCQSNDLIHDAGNVPWRFISCNQCEQEGPPAGSHAECVRLWNTRAPITVEQARKVVEDSGMACVPINHLMHVSNQLHDASAANLSTTKWIQGFIKSAQEEL